MASGLGRECVRRGSWWVLVMSCDSCVISVGPGLPNHLINIAAMDQSLLF